MAWTWPAKHCYCTCTGLLHSILHCARVSVLFQSLLLQLQTLLEDGRYCMSCWFKVRQRNSPSPVHVMSDTSVFNNPIARSLCKDQPCSLSTSCLRCRCFTAVDNEGAIACLAAGCAKDTGARAFCQPLGGVPDVHGEYPHDGGGWWRRQRVVREPIFRLVSSKFTLLNEMLFAWSTTFAPNNKSMTAGILRSTHCREAFMDNFAYANRTVSMLLGCEQARLLRLGLTLPSCCHVI